MLCVQETKKGSQLLAEVGVLFQCIRYENGPMSCTPSLYFVFVFFLLLFSLNTQNLVGVQMFVLILFYFYCGKKALAKHDIILFLFRFPVVAMGLLKWVDFTVSDPSFFKLLTDSTPVHLALLDEVSLSASQIRLVTKDSDL